MDFSQGTVGTVHDLTGSPPTVEPESVAAVVPMTASEHGQAPARGVLRAFEALDPVSIVVPIRASGSAAASLADWIADIAPSAEVLWCNAPAMSELMDDVGIELAGKGGDVWLATGVAAADAETVCYFDADVASVDPADIARLIAPLSDSTVQVSKAYYARVEQGRMYGRLFRLLYRPLVRAIEQMHPHPYTRYLADFRYALAGEFAVDSTLVTEWSVPPDMGLEVATLGEAYRTTGPAGVVQVDLGRHRHDHRPVDGEAGLASIAPQVTGAIYRTLETVGIDPDPGTLADRYRVEAERLIEHYARDARLNGLSYDLPSERNQVSAYEPAVSEPNEATWLPAWSNTRLDPARVLAAGAIGDLETATGHETP